MKTPPVTIIERARRYVSKMPEAISGQHGHSTMFSVACVLVQGFSLDMADARMLLAEYNATLTEPFNEREVDHKLQDAAKAQSARGQGYLLNASDRTANIRVTPKKPVNRPPQTVQRVCFGTLGTGISYRVLKSIYKNKKKTIRESDLGVPPVPKLGNNKAKPDKESEKGVPPVPRGGGKPTLSPAGVLRIPMNTPIRYRYWLKGTSFEPAGVEILSLSEIRSSLFGKNIPAKTGN